jgi:hypothetical protein
MNLINNLLDTTKKMIFGHAYFFDMFAQVGGGGFKLMASASLGVVPSE